MRNTIGLRLSLGFLVMVMLLLAVGGVGAWYGARVNAAIQEVSLQTDHLADLVSMQTAIGSAEQSLQASLGDTSRELTPEEVASLMASTKAYMDISGSFVTAMMEKTDTVRTSMSAAVAEAQRAQQTSRVISITLSIVAAALGVILAIVIGRSITRPISHLVRTADTLSTGDLETPVVAHTKDEVGELAESLERMRVSLKAVMERVRAR